MPVLSPDVVDGVDEDGDVRVLVGVGRRSRAAVRCGRTPASGSGAAGRRARTAAPWRTRSPRRAGRRAPCRPARAGAVPARPRRAARSSGSTVIRMPAQRRPVPSATSTSRRTPPPPGPRAGGGPSASGAARSGRRPTRAPRRPRPRRRAGPRPARPRAASGRGGRRSPARRCGSPSIVASQVTSSPSLTVSAVSGVEACGSVSGRRADHSATSTSGAAITTASGRPTDDAHHQQGQPDDGDPEVGVGRAPAGHRRHRPATHTRSRAVGAGTWPSTRLDHGPARDVGHPELGADGDPVRERGHGHRLHVLGYDEVAPVDHGVRRGRRASARARRAVTSRPGCAGAARVAAASATQ